MAHTSDAEIPKVDEVRVDIISLPEEPKGPAVNIVTVTAVSPSLQALASEPVEEVSTIETFDGCGSYETDAPPETPHVTSPKNIKRRRQATFDDYDQHEEVTDEHTLRKNIHNVFAVKTESSEHAEAPSTTVPDASPHLPAERSRMYDDISVQIIGTVKKASKNEFTGIREFDYVQLTREISRRIDTFITEHRSELGLGEAAMSGMIAANDAKAVTRAFSRIQHARKREKMAQTLAWCNQECYRRIINTNLITRLSDQESSWINKSAQRKKNAETLVRCVADTQKGSRCTGQASTERHRVWELLQKLGDLSQPREFGSVAEILRTIVNWVFCGQHHHSKKAEYGIDKLYCHFYGVADQEQKAEREFEVVQLQQWISDLVAPMLPQVQAILDGLEHDQNVERDDPDDSKIPREAERMSTFTALFLFDDKTSYQQRTVMITPVSHRSNPEESPHFVPFKHKRNRKNLPLAQFIKDDIKRIANEKLIIEDRGKMRGHIYIFWNQRDFRYVKIGYTAEKAEDRVGDWSAQCGFTEPGSEYKPSVVTETLHFQRVEKLIHAELQEQRCEEVECHGCGSSHNEWFKTGREAAESSAIRWKEWMDKEPYDEEGHIKPEFKNPEVVKDGNGNLIVQPDGTDGQVKIEQRRSERIKAKKIAMKAKKR